MSVESHIQAIAQKREAIKAQIAEEMCHPMPDFAKITGLKKTNMKLKEEMMRYMIELNEASSA
jgi:hypothetical protein